jgi:hypothetical protein
MKAIAHWQPWMLLNREVSNRWRSIRLQPEKGEAA